MKDLVVLLHGLGRERGMQEFHVLHRTHTLLPWAPDAIGATFAFLGEPERRRPAG